MRRWVLYGAMVGIVLAILLTVTHALAPGPWLYYLDPLIPLLWPSSILLLGFKDPAYPTNLAEYAWFAYCIGINACLYGAFGGLCWKAKVWVEEQNRLHRDS